MRPGFSVMRKRPLGNKRHGPRIVQVAGDRGDADVHRLVVRRVSLAGKDRMVGLEFRRPFVDRLAFDREILERPAPGRAFPPAGVWANSIADVANVAAATPVVRRELNRILQLYDLKRHL